MNILQFNKFFYLRGGAERHYFDVIDLLEEKGHTVIHFSMQDSRNRPSPYSTYFVSHLELGDIQKTPLTVAGRILYSREAARKLSALIDKTKPDVAHVHLAYYHLSHAVLRVLHNKKIPIVYTIHDWKLICPHYILYPEGACGEKSYAGSVFNAIRYRCFKNSFLASTLAVAEYLLSKRWYRYIDALIAPSQFVKDKFESLGWHGAPITVVPHFVEIPNCTRAARLFKTDDTVLFAGRLAPEKGLRFLLSAWAKQNIPYRLRIAGSGPLEIELKEFVRKHGLKDRVEFLGFLGKQELIKVMAQAGLLVIPSEFYEAFAYSVIESSAAGLPVLSSNIGPTPEYLKKSGGGWTYPLGNGKAFARQINTIMGDVEGRKKAAQKGAEFVKQSFSKAKFYDRLMKVYGRVSKQTYYSSERPHVAKPSA